MLVSILHSLPLEPSRTRMYLKTAEADAVLNDSLSVNLTTSSGTLGEESRQLSQCVDTDSAYGGLKSSRILAADKLPDPSPHSAHFRR